MLCFDCVGALWKASHPGMRKSTDKVKNWTISAETGTMKLWLRKNASLRYEMICRNKKGDDFVQQPPEQKPWGQSHRPVPPPPEEQPRYMRRKRRPHRSRLGLVFMAIGFMTVCLVIFRYLIVPLLVMLNGGA